MNNFYIPDYKEFCNGYEAYGKKERRGIVYFEVSSIISDHWGDPPTMARGISRLIRSWNRYYANFDLDKLIICIDKNFKRLEWFRNNNITSLSDDDGDSIKSLFNQFLDALKRVIDGRKSPVSVGKTLGLLNPNYFPIWDSNIAFKYDCFYLSDDADGPYFEFCKKMKLMAEHVKNYVPNPDDRSLLKRIDEYNYSKYTMHWI
jgi:hypothetical protein